MRACAAAWCRRTRGASSKWAGSGFELLIPEKDRETLSPMEGEVIFHTHLVVREDRLTLFGFLHRADRDLFLEAD